MKLSALKRVLDLEKPVRTIQRWFSFVSTLRFFTIIVSSIMVSVGTSIFAFFGIIMPLQYREVIEDAIDRIWPFFFAVTILTLYSLLALWMLRSARLHSALLTILALGAVVVALITGLLVSGPSIAFFSAAAAAGSLLSIGVAFVRSDSSWHGLPTKSRTVWPSLTLGALIYLAFGLATVIKPLELPRVVGSLTLLSVFIGFLSVMGCAMILRPRFGLCLMIYCLIAGLFFGGNDHRIPTVPRSIGVVNRGVDSASGPHELGEAFHSWLQSRRDLAAYRDKGLPYPVILVSSEGGGIYAAAHSYSSLLTLSAHCRSFGQHVFAIVGVSGGALGNALFSAALDPNQQASQPCTETAQSAKPGPLAEDHLSPVLARLLLIEPLDRLLPGQWMRRDRAQVLADSFLSSTAEKQRPYLMGGVGESFDTNGARPAVISVAVNVGNGKRFIMSPVNPVEFAGTGRWWPDPAREVESNALGKDIGEQISLIDAAGVSARFPWITPTGQIKLRRGEDVVLADGGYFDNSGADTVIDIINALKMGARTQTFVISDSLLPTWVDENAKCSPFTITFAESFRSDVSDECEIRVFFMHIAFSSVTGKTPSQTPSFLFDPIKTLLSTRSSRGEIALQRAQLEQCGAFRLDVGCLSSPGNSQGFFRYDIDPEKLRLPLGWFMSSEGFDQIGDNRKAPNIYDERGHRINCQSDIGWINYYLNTGLHSGIIAAVGDTWILDSDQAIDCMPN
jgi:hypothetical protein